MTLDEWIAFFGLVFILVTCLPGFIRWLFDPLGFAGLFVSEITIIVKDGEPNEIIPHWVWQKRKYPNETNNRD